MKVFAECKSLPFVFPLVKGSGHTAEIHKASKTDPISCKSLGNFLPFIPIIFVGLHICVCGWVAVYAHTERVCMIEIL